jgi:hypothetical protein
MTPRLCVLASEVLDRADPAATTQAMLERVATRIGATILRPAQKRERGAEGGIGRSLLSEFSLQISDGARRVDRPPPSFAPQYQRRVDMRGAARWDVTGHHSCKQEEPSHREKCQGIPRGDPEKQARNYTRSGERG